MPTVLVQLVVGADSQAVWQYVTRVENWMPALEGYRSHEALSATQYVMFLAGDVGVFQKVTPLEVTITEQREPERIAFSVSGRNDPIRGDGHFVARPADTGGTALDFSLTLSGKGPLGPVIDVALNGIVARAVDGLAGHIRNQFLGGEPGVGRGV